VKRFKPIVSIYLILIENGKVLLLKRANTGYEDGNYGIPSGHLENNETIREGLQREVKEEIGIKINVDDLRLVHVMHRKEKDIRVDFFFKVRKYQGAPINNESEKCTDLRWFPLDKLPVNIIPYIKVAISKSMRKIIYSEIGWK